MSRKILAVSLTTIGGLCYLIGTFVGTFFAAVFGAFAALAGKTSVATASNAVSLVFLLGIASGVAIIAGGALVFASSKLRKIGGILVIAMTIVGAVPTVAGLLFGFVLSLVGGILVLTYKEKKKPLPENQQDLEASAKPTITVGQSAN